MTTEGSAEFAFAEQVAGIAALDEPTRARLYQWVVEAGEPVSRDQAAAALGIARSVAAFHLDKLVDAGLLETEFRRLTGRRGPGAGRPAKLYRRSSRELQVSLPERRYDVAGRVLADAVWSASSQDVPIDEAVATSARDLGRSLASRVRDRAGAGASATQLRGALLEVLGEQGYGPQADSERITLGNCPFRLLAQDYTDLVCEMNLTALAETVAAVPEASVHAELSPAPGRCCVELRLDEVAGAA
ncbi:MAG TPA: helix-turn-helix domain-containing protein [Actinomycetes bacterium]|nr:helix-turn-helix domain-containing protein [Actinomycetes bacterium]